MFILRYFDVSLDNFTIFEIQFGGNTIETVFLWIHILSFISYLSSWLGDLISVGYWNSGELLIYFGDSASLNDTKQSASRTAIVIHKSDNLIEQARHNVKGKNSLSSENIRQFQILARELKRLNRKQKRHRVFFYYYFFGWYFTVPILAGATAIQFWLEP